MALDAELVKILVCPACKAGLEYHSQRNRLDCAACRKYYPIHDDIPVLLIEEAKSF